MMQASRAHPSPRCSHSLAKGNWWASTLRLMDRPGHQCSGRGIEPSGIPHASFAIGVFLSLSSPTGDCGGSIPPDGAPQVWTRLQCQGLTLHPVMHLPPRIGLACVIINLVLSLPRHLLVTLFAQQALYLLHRKVHLTIFTLFGHVGFKEGKDQNPHKCCPASLGVKARPGPGANVMDSERVTCYSTLHTVQHATS